MRIITEEWLNALPDALIAQSRDLKRRADALAKQREKALETLRRFTQDTEA